ncbi:MAG: GlsB/YeaQ/YmgE family stress response membrane protein [Pseudomonadota bacterium]
MSFVLFIIIGGIAGFLAGKIMKGRGFGLFGNIGVGVVGSVLGSYVFDLLGISANSLVGSGVTATAGAVLLLWVVGIIKKS